MSIGTLSRRSVGLLLAVALAAFATAAWVSYVRSIESKATRGSATVQTYVARESIPAGTTAEFAASKNLFEKAAIPRRLLAQGAVTDLAAIRGRVASSTVVKGEQILLSRFVSAEQAGRLLNIPADKHAFAVEVAAPPGVGGFVRPKDHVSIIAKVDRNDLTEVRFLMQDVEVLAVGLQTTAVPPSSGARESARREQVAEPVAPSKMIMTLAVTPAQAEQLAFAVLEGQIYFTLLPPNSKPAGTPGRTADSLFR